METNMPLDNVGKADAGNVTIVGSIAELAALLGGMTQEQLNNVQLDPALLALLHQTFGLSQDGQALANQPVFEYPLAVDQFENSASENQHEILCPSDPNAVASIGGHTIGAPLQNEPDGQYYIGDGSGPVEMHGSIENVQSIQDMLSAGQGLVDMMAISRATTGFSNSPVKQHASSVEETLLSSSVTDLSGNSTVPMARQLQQASPFSAAVSTATQAQTLSELTAQLLSQASNEPETALETSEGLAAASYTSIARTEQGIFNMYSATSLTVSSKSEIAKTVTGSLASRGLVAPVLQGIPQINSASASLTQTLLGNKIQQPKTTPRLLQPVISSTPLQGIGRNPLISTSGASFTAFSSSARLPASRLAAPMKSQLVNVVRELPKVKKPITTIGQATPETRVASSLVKSASIVKPVAVKPKIMGEALTPVSKTSFPLVESKPPIVVHPSPVKATLTTQVFSSISDANGNVGSSNNNVTTTRTSLVIGSGPNAKQIFLSPEQLSKLMQAQPGQKVVCVVKQKSTTGKPPKGAPAVHASSSLDLNQSGVGGVTHSGMYTFKRADLEKVVNAGVANNGVGLTESAKVAVQAGHDSMLPDTTRDACKSISKSHTVAKQSHSISKKGGLKIRQVVQESVSIEKDPELDFSDRELLDSFGTENALMSSFDIAGASQSRADDLDQTRLVQVHSHSTPKSSILAEVKKGALKRKGVPTSLATQNKKSRKSHVGDSSAKKVRKIVSPVQKATLKRKPASKFLQGTKAVVQKSEHAKMYAPMNTSFDGPEQQSSPVNNLSSAASGSMKRERPLPKKFEDFDMTDALSHKKASTFYRAEAVNVSWPAGVNQGVDIGVRKKRGRPRKIRSASAEVSADSGSLLSPEQSKCPGFAVKEEPVMRQAVVTVERLPPTPGVASPTSSAAAAGTLADACVDANSLEMQGKQASGKGVLSETYRMGAKLKRRKRRTKKIPFVGEELPEHLKKVKPKVAVVEDAVIDLSKVRLKSIFAEKSFVLPDAVSASTARLLAKRSYVCTLCGKPACIGNLDVLFGPYKVRIGDVDDSTSPPKGKKKRMASAMTVWLHRDCAIWTPNICLIGQALHGLGETLEVAANSKCSLCSNIGATLACGDQSCRDLYHYVCARQRGCSFNEESFMMICPKHR